MGVCYRTPRILLNGSLAIAVGLAQANPPLFIYQTPEGVTVFSDSPVDPGNLVRQSYRPAMRPIAAQNSCKGLTRRALQARGHAPDEPISHASDLYSSDKALIKAVARAESCFDPFAVSRAGARGLMQLMLERYAADTLLTLAAYNAGARQR